MGNESARGFGLEKADITVQESIDALVKLVGDDYGLSNTDSHSMHFSDKL